MIKLSERGKLELGQNKRPSVLYAKKFLKTVNTAVEIGVSYGVNSVYIIQELSPQKLYLVDPFVYGSFSSEKEKIAPASFEECRKTFEDEISASRVILIAKESHIASSEVPNNLDFVYIDGSHSDFNVTIDIACWYPKVRIGGIIAGHDYIAPGVINAVNRFFLGRAFTDSGDWWTIKEEGY